MSNRELRPKIVPDSTYPGMYRVRWPDGTLSDMVNLTRANDAVAFFLESAERRKRRAAQAHRSPVVSQNPKYDPPATDAVKS
jgi:hypothetical protein